jgi:hypothetical protein
VLYRELCYFGCMKPALSSRCFRIASACVIMLLFTFSFVSYSQNSIKVKKVKKVNVNTLDGKGVLYKGAVNPVYFVLVNDTSAKLSIKCSKNIKLVGKNRRFKVTVDSGSSALFIVSQVMASGKLSFVDSVKVKITNIPSPIVSVAGRMGTDTISKSVLMRVDSLELVMLNFKCLCTFRVLSFSMSAMMGGTYVDMAASSNSITANMKNIIGKMNAGGKIYFENVTVLRQDGTLMKVPGVNFKLN